MDDLQRVTVIDYYKMANSNRTQSARERFNISRLAIAYPWLTLGFWIAVAVAGLLALSSLKYALFPDITFPVVVVNTQAPLTAALETETRVTQLIEQQLQSVKGLDDIRSSTYPGQSVVSLSFDVGTNLESSTEAVETALKQVTLPKDAKVKVIPLNLNESAAVSYAIESTSRQLDDLGKLTEAEIKPAIEKVPGVLKVNLLGTTTAPKPATPNQNPAAALANPGTRVRFDGKDAVAFQVIKRSDANTLEVVNRVEQEVSRLQTKWPDIKLNIASTQAEYIRQATHSTIDALLEAIVLAVVVIFPFLWNWKATLISALAIPASLLGTCIVMAIYGFNLETITLLALALVIGSVVDDAIVDVENISRHIADGESPRQAALKATSEVGLPVTAATFTAVAVFLPIGLMGGVIGQFFKPFGITVSAAMLASLLVARTLSPVLSIYWLRPRPDQAPQRESRLWLGFCQGYQNLLHWSLQHRGIVMVIALLSLVAGIAMIPFVPKGFIPKLDRGEFNVTYTAPLPKIPAELLAARANPAAAATNLPAGMNPADANAAQLAAAANAGQLPANLPPGAVPPGLAAVPQLPNPLEDSLKVAKELEAVILRYPEVEKSFAIVGSREGEPNKGTIYVKLKQDRKIRTPEFQDQLRAALPKLEGVTTGVEDISFVESGSSQKPLQVALKGDNLNQISQAARDLQARLQQLSGIADVSLTGATTTNNPVTQIERRDGQRVVYLSANLGKNLSLGEATETIEQEAQKILPAGVSLRLGGDSARSNEVFSSFGTTLALSAVCILVVLVWLFQSAMDPLVVCLSLPLALVGAMAALLLTRSDFGMISLIGFVFLLGLANKNAILIVDYINQLRREGLGRTDAILKAGPIRLRPILMTTASTILGMLPIALGLGAGSELRSPMAVAIAGGLVSSTLLSLIVVPVVYTLLDDVQFKLFRIKR